MQRMKDCPLKEITENKEEKGMGHVKAQIKAGDTVTAYGYDWEILDPKYEGMDGPGILCLTKDFVRIMAFARNDCNDYTKSAVRKWLDEDFTPKLEEQGAEFRTAKLGLMADDGTGWDKEPLEVKGAFLLTDGLYRRYRRYISDKGCWWWTATAYSFISGNLRYVRYVKPDGSRSHNPASYGHYGLVPACIFSFLPEQMAKDPAEEIEELKKRVAELEKRVRMTVIECENNDCVHNESGRCGCADILISKASGGACVTYATLEPFFLGDEKG